MSEPAEGALGLSVEDAAARFAQQPRRYITPDGTPIETPPEGSTPPVEPPADPADPPPVGDPEEGSPQGEPETPPEGEPVGEPTEPLPEQAVAFEHFDAESGETTPVTLEEARSGYLRQRDYTRKTMELSEQRRALEGEREQLVAEAGRMQAMIDALEGMQRDGGSPFQGMSREQVAELQATDPGRFAMLRMQEADRQALLEEARTKAAEAQSEAQRLEIPKQRAALAERVPAFAGEKFDAEYEKLGRYALGSGGLSREEWDGLTDHRLLALLWKASRYDEVTRSAPKKKANEGPARTIRPGTTGAHPETAGEAMTRAEEATWGRLRKTGSVEDAAAALLARRKAGHTKVIR